MDAALKRILSDIALFSAHVLERPLRPYQLEPARAIVDSVLNRKGLTFTVMMSRQAGKNELSAQVEAYLLNRFQRRGGSIVKCAPTFAPQLHNSMGRLQDLLDNPWNAGRWRRVHEYGLAVGRGTALFLSAQPQANVMGATASLLLEVDEAQDVEEHKYDRDFRPMAASTNATTVLYGTAWGVDSLLERQKRLNLGLEHQDGVRRHFGYPWEAVAASLPAYRAYVEAEIARLGADHPTILTQYCLQALDYEGRLLDRAQLAQLQGDHARARGPAPGATYVAGVDVGGETTEAEPPVGAAGARPQTGHQQDSTVITIAEVLGEGGELRVVEHYRWTGRSHPEQVAAAVDILGNVWGVQRVAVDATGMGQPLAGFLARALGRRRVEPVAFTAASKSRLAYGLLAAINGGRLKMYAGDGSGEWREFWRQAVACRRTLRPGQLLDFCVPPEQGHDDFVASLALCAHAAEGVLPRKARGRRASGGQPAAGRTSRTTVEDPWL